MNVQDELKEILKAILAALEQKLHLIGSKIESEAAKLALEWDIRDKGDFYRNIGYAVKKNGRGYDLFVGSNVPHEPYVLGGKVPSWTPIEPLKGWVERKGLSWMDEDGQPLSVEQMAYMIRAKIKREGIPARNIFEEVLRNKEQWIYQQIDSIQAVMS